MAEFACGRAVIRLVAGVYAIIPRGADDNEAVDELGDDIEFPGPRPTGLGNVADKIVKKQRKTFGTLRDLLRAKSVGVIEEDRALGLVKYAKPMGVVAAVTPSTNPGATPVNKAMMVIKGRNAVVIAPSPSGYKTTARTVELMRSELEKTGLPADLVQILPAPITKDATQALMEAVDLVVVTGSQDNVRRAYSSGTPAVGVGAGNVPVVIDATCWPSGSR